MKTIKQLRKDLWLSQQQVADHLQINRVSYSLSENWKREWKPEELEKLSDILQIPEHSLLWDTYTTNTEFNEIRFENLLLYILSQVGIKPTVWKTVLYKLLYFIDFDYYEKYGEKYTGVEYIRLPRWPAPYGFDFIIQQMKTDDKILIADQNYRWYSQKKYYPNQIVTSDTFDNKILPIIEYVLANYSDLNASEISQVSHDDIPRIKTDPMQIIDYDLAWERQYPFSIRAREIKKEQALEHMQAVGAFDELADEPDLYDEY
jgi:transcriptional regulator with XRE-family HTH domain